jgi:hypothetical protein
MRCNLPSNHPLIRVIAALIFSLIAFAGHASAEASGALATTKPDFVNGGGNSPHITNMDELMNLKPEPNVNVHGIGIYVYDGMFSLDALGPYQVFRSAALNTFLIAKHKGNITRVITESGVQPSLK